MKTGDKKLGQKIREIRKRRNMSIQDLAERLDVSKQMISYWESGSKGIRTQRLIKLASILGVKMVDFFSEEEITVEDEHNFYEKAFGIEPKKEIQIKEEGEQ